MKTKIAFFKEITGDLDSPLEIYLKFKNDKNSYFFESVEEEINGHDTQLSVCQPIKKFLCQKTL